MSPSCPLPVPCLLMTGASDQLAQGAAGDGSTITGDGAEFFGSQQACIRGTARRQIQPTTRRPTRDLENTKSSFSPPLRRRIPFCVGAASPRGTAAPARPAGSGRSVPRGSSGRGASTIAARDPGSTPWRASGASRTVSGPPSTRALRRRASAARRVCNRQSLYALVEGFGSRRWRRRLLTSLDHHPVLTRPGWATRAS